MQMCTPDWPMADTNTAPRVIKDDGSPWLITTTTKKTERLPTVNLLALNVSRRDSLTLIKGELTQGD